MREFSEKLRKLITEDFASINLTRIESEDEFFNKQIYDSVLPLEKSKIFKQQIEKRKLLFDIGFGGGFPLLPIAHHYIGSVSCVGMEARAKKANVVQSMATMLGLSNVKTFHQRVEDVLFDLPCVITFKAVGTIEECLKNINAGTDQLGVYFYKGPNLDELENLDMVKQSWEIIEDITFEVPMTNGRRFIGFSPKNVPRGTKESNNSLVTASSLIS